MALKINHVFEINVPKQQFFLAFFVVGGFLFLGFF
jgi:hypothetical protein